jgi:hypothetical protein
VRAKKVDPEANRNLTQNNAALSTLRRAKNARATEKIDMTIHEKLYKSQRPCPRQQSIKPVNSLTFPYKAI